MHRNKLWLGLLGIIFLSVTFFTGKAFFQIYRHYSLSSSTTVDEITWAVEQVHSDRNYIRANYAFTVGEHAYQGETIFLKPTFLNPWAAEQQIAKYTSQKWKVWYSPRNPGVSSLQKSFPLKESISAGILWTLFLYFIWLGIYVTKTHS